MKPFEFRWIESLQSKLGKAPKELKVGIGDDAALLEMGKSTWISTDTLVEGVHFRHSWMAPRDLGYKSLAINISDLLAKGARPRFALLNLGLPFKDEKWTEEFAGGFMALASKSGVHLIGGDTVRSPHITVTITILGEASDKIVLRSTAEVGDVLAVTGTLGDSAAGLTLLESGYLRGSDPLSDSLVSQHLRPVLRWKESAQVYSLDGLHAAMDLSDDLVSSLFRMSESSKIAFEINSSQIPVSSALRSQCSRPPLDYALYGGEDFELLACLTPSAAESLDPKLWKIIGQVLPRDSTKSVYLLHEGQRRPLAEKGYQHFPD